ncbi:ERCC4 domain-containing protein [Pullulanibacillus sp. KACC 23026]|uniref:ERCC4 domain-containing protein n=1 Tax=Pullulanibacillus sp. KACC 23026 TaxID=3028315 RepID=UPI0023B13BA7|nr:ERCC4 domain-containing protein [Pullulanibacillus sp. KACC 23026]WEG13983.1 ERCC4 domain-containing protein [Pullulanibacillus sp. KACC 23026]
MNALNFRYTDKELKTILDSLIIIIDTREKGHSVITEYLRFKNIPFKFQKLNTGDYSAMLPANPELGIIRDTYFNIVIERKNSIDEFAQNTKEDRFENELIRSHGMNFLLVIEDTYENLINGKYRSKYDPKALLGRLKTFEARYNFNTVFMERKLMGNFVYHHLYYQVRNVLKGK